MNFKRVLVLVVVFAMLTSTFAPALGIFATEINNNTNESTSENKHYVSIGDSMTNGYGFEGYLQGETGHDFLNGVGTYGEGSYALQFESYLKEKYGADNVDHTKLAASALRAEDLLYLLGGRNEPADDWFDEVEYYTGKSYAELAPYYQNAVKDADIITLGIGNASFGAFMLSRITSALGVMGGSLSAEQIEAYTLENALALLENEDDKAKVLELYNKFQGLLFSYVGAEIATTYKLDLVCNIFAYVTANFILNFAKSVDKIVELNEKENLEVILIGLMNTTYGMVITVDENTSIPFGDIMDEMFGALNAYISAYVSAKQLAGEYEGVKFLYAEQTNPAFIVNALDDLAANNWENVDNGRLSADIVRSRTISTYNGTLRLMIGAGFIAGVNAGISASVEAGVLEYFRGEFGVTPEMMSDEDFKQLVYDYGYGDAFETALAENMVGRLLPDDFNMLPTITLADVEAFEANTPATWNDPYFFMNVTDCRNLSIAVYLAIEEAIVQSVAVEDIPLDGLQTIAGDLMSLFDGFAPDTTSPMAVYNDLVSFFTTDALLPLVKIYAIFQIGNGMCVHPTPSAHDALYEEIVKAYESDWTVQKQTIKDAYDYITEYYDEAYFYGYKYADENGYVDVAADAILTAIDAIKLAIVEVENGLLGTTDELTAELVKELYATIETLEELYEVLVNDSAKDVDGFVATIFALEDDLWAHLNNIWAILRQAGIDVNQLVLLPAFNEALRILNEEVIPAVVAAAEAFLQAAVEYMQDMLADAYAALLNVSKEVANKIIETLTEMMFCIQGEIEEAFAEAFATLIATLYDVLGNINDAVLKACEIITGIINALDARFDGAVSALLAKMMTVCADLVKSLCEKIDNVEELINTLIDIVNFVIDAVDFTVVAIDTVEQMVAEALEAFNHIFNTVVKMYNTVEEAVEVTKSILANIVDTVIRVNAYVENVIVEAAKAYAALVETLKGIYGTAQEVLNVAYGIFNEIVDTLVRVNGTINDVIKNAVDIYNTIITTLANTYANLDNIVRVAMQLFGYLYDFWSETLSPEALMEMFKGLVEIIIEAYGNTRDAYYVVSQIYAYLADLNVEGFRDILDSALEGNYELKDESEYVALGQPSYGEELAGMLNLMDKYNRFDLNGEYAEAVADADLITIRVSNGEALDFIMAQLENPFDLKPLPWEEHLNAEGQEALRMVLEAVKADLVASGAAEELLKTVGMEGIFEPEFVAGIMVYALENTIYAYAEFIDRLTTVLDEVTVLSPEATVVLTAVESPAVTMGLDLGEYTVILDTVVAALNAQLFAAALAYDNVIYVDSNDAEDIYDALNVYCDHVYDNCEDTTCNRCLAERVAPGHSFGEYVSNNDATCTADGTKTAHCEYCDATDTVADPGSKLEHAWGEWHETKAPTATEAGEESRECSRCGAVEIRPVDPIPTPIPWLAIIIGAAVVLAGVAAAVVLTIKKRRA